MGKLLLPPGVSNNAPRRLNSTNWRETNLVRWVDNTLRPVKGWEEAVYTTFASKVRAVHKWFDNAGVSYVAFLCEQHCYVWSNSSDTTIDITPVGGLYPPPVVGQGGFGDDVYGSGDYGDPRNASDRNTPSPPVYSVDNWGQELRVMTSSDGRLLRWDPATPATVLTAVASAPTGNRMFVITHERHVMLFGANGDNSLFMWSDQENDSVWTPSTTSKAGEFNVEPRSPIVTAITTPFGVVMYTGRSAYVVRYIGLPYVYQYEQISESPPPLSPSSVSLIPDGALWVGHSGFWLYNGASSTPVTCPVWDWVQSHLMGGVSKFEASMVRVPAQFEVWWFFTSTDSSSENDLVVIFNYKNNVWSMGKLGRTCGFSVYGDDTLMMSDGVKVYNHEVGYSYAGAPELPWAETFTMNVNNGSSMMTIKQMLPDVSGNPSDVQFRLVKVGNPSSSSETLTSAKVVRSNGYVDVRETARDFRLRVEMVGNRDWSIGPINVDVVQRGNK